MTSRYLSASYEKSKIPADLKRLFTSENKYQQFGEGLMDKDNLKIMSLILARGGSTGVPGKNIKPLCGKPLLAHTIEISQQSKFINRTVVATDSEAIADVAREYGADVPFMRPDDMSQKLSRAYDVYKYFLNGLQEKEDYRPDIVTLLFSTSYSKVVEDVDAAIEKLITTKCDWVFTVSPCEHHPHYFFRPISEDKMQHYIPFVDSYNLWGNRQELPPVYRIDGNAFVTWSENIENYTTYNVDMINHADKDIRYILCDEENAQDINTPLEFEFAEYLMSKRLNK